MLFFDIAVEIEPDLIDPDSFERDLIAAAGEQEFSVTYEWGVTVFFPMMADDLLHSISKSLNIVKQTKANIIGIDSDQSDLDTHVVISNACRSSR